jgi:phage replication O-like protein O
MKPAAKVIDMGAHRGAGPQLEDGYLRIANELFDAILSFKFTYRQIKVLMAVARKTYGYGKKSDDISASQIGEICGLQRQHVATALVELEQLNVLFRAPGKYGTVTSINKRHSEWKTLKKSEMEKVNDGFGGAVSKAPETRANHYVYRLDHEGSGTFYIGVRSCDCPPIEDPYKGSGRWSARIPKAEIKKTIISIHSSRNDAEVAEKIAINAVSATVGLGNVQRHFTALADPETGLELVPNQDAPSPETGLELVPNQDTSVVPVWDTQKTTFQKTTPKDNHKSIARSGDRAALADWSDSFDAFWQTFGKKDGKANAIKAWGALGASALKAGESLSDLLQTVLHAAALEADRRPSLLAKGHTPIYAQGWLSQRRFEDESLLSWGRYSEDAVAVLEGYNAALGAAGWAEVGLTPYLPSRAAAIAAFLAAGLKPGFSTHYFAYVAENVPPADTTGFDWLIRVDTYTKIREGVHRAKEAVQ